MYTTRIEKWVRTADNGKRYAVRKITTRDSYGRFHGATNLRGTERLTLVTDVRKWNR
jgi:hypothetical protein